ncbi:hypothetical protein B0H13DRAFT_1863085 [Mycena leptocephala]|nr:hypothetical protein B0H13DRAFT_1863085 [Mycena leptocephala]
MLETIRRLKERIEELELLVDSDPSRVYLSQPYTMPHMQEMSPGHFPRMGFEGSPPITLLGGMDRSSTSPFPLSLRLAYGTSAIGPSICFVRTHVIISPSYPRTTIYVAASDLSTPTPELRSATTHHHISVDIFLGRFSRSVYFFIDSFQFRQTALLPLPFGHHDRPSPALLSAVYLWGSILLDVPPKDPHTPDAFLMCVIQNVPQDLTSVGVHSKLILETLQAEVLLSLYFMHSADLMQGRYHSAAATSIALGARLHLVGPQQQHYTSYPAFPMGTSLINEGSDAVNKVDAFWAVVILSNCWVAADGAPSSISSGLTIDTPWEGGSITERFLHGANTEGLTPVTCLAKAGVLLEHVVSFPISNHSDAVLFTSLERRLLNFQALLPQLPGDHNLILAHALTDLAILRLHAPYTSASEHSRYQAFAASARIVGGIEGMNTINLRHIDPVFGLAAPDASALQPIYWTIASFYMSEINIAAHRSPGFNIATQTDHELEAGLNRLMSGLASLAPHGPMFEHCSVDVRMAYDNIPR